MSTEEGCYHSECFYVKDGYVKEGNVIRDDYPDFKNYKDGWYLGISPRFGGEYNIYSILYCPFCGKKLVNELD